jgi:putative SOS response-associated peptidase YedK
MCGGFECQVPAPGSGEVVRRKIFFPIPHAQIPYLAPEGSMNWAQWGRRQGEDPDLNLPVGGWARLISLKEGRWNQYEPRRVRIPALRWMEKDSSKVSHWFDLPPNQYMLGVLIERVERQFVYVVTHPAKGEFAEVHHRMPFLVGPEPQRVIQG